MSTVRIVEGWIEVDYQRVAKLEPGLSATVLARLTWFFEDVEDDLWEEDEERDEA